MTKGSRPEAIFEIVKRLRAMSPAVSTEGLFVRGSSHDSSNPLFHLIPWHEFTLDDLNHVKVDLRRGEDFTIGPRRYLDTDGNFIAIIGVAFASNEFLLQYGFVMDPTGRITSLPK